MIKNIYIKNFAIIDELLIEFKNGLNIITGETGSGKTLIIKAIQYILGKKFSSGMLGPHGNKIIIEGEFEHKGKNCIIRRIFDSTGRSRSFIDDEPIKQIDLIHKTREMLDMHGQHEHQRLLSSDSHIKYLDSFMSDESLIIDISSHYANIINLRNKLDEMEKERAKLIESQELHDLQYKELSQYPLSIDYYDKINKKHNLMNSLIEVKELSMTAMRFIEGDSTSIIEQSMQLIKILNLIGRYDNDFNKYSNIINSKIIDLQDLSNSLHKINSANTISKDESDEINDIFIFLQMLKRKYGGTIESVIDYRDQLMKNHGKKDDHASVIKEIEEKINKYKNKYLEKCKILSMNRKKHAKILEEKVNGTLKELGMLNSNFNIVLKYNDESFTINGMDECRFYLSSNAGHDPQPLDKIVSGGEMSRIMLAIKLAFQEKDLVSSLIFDEIDAGISGKIAEKVGLSMEELSTSQQVICITHLSQIASKGKCHVKIYKHEADGKVKVKVKSLDIKERVMEIASLISGELITESGYVQAKTLLS